ncbi:MAG: pentapeptide repeat-containing protein [Gammaproteobacteria bacterium]|nr:pentapeptide repeat-containing protein [Gammaproteobacteria bacterium]
MNLEEKAEFLSEKFEGEDFSGIGLSAKEFDACSFDSCNFSDSTFNKCKFIDCEFNKCNLSNIKIGYSKFTDVSFYESKLIGVNWTDASWSSWISHSPIKFYKSIINDCSFYGLTLQELILEECKAHQVDFRTGDFSGANFNHTDFTGSSFGKTILTAADFTEAINYDIDIFNNRIERAKFSRFEAVRLLDSLEIELVD